MVPMISLLYARSCAMLMTELLPDKGSFVSWLKSGVKGPAKGRRRGRLRAIFVCVYEETSPENA